MGPEQGGFDVQLSLDQGGSASDSAASPIETSGPAPLLIVLSGPSGVGKDAVMAGLRALGRPWHFAITMTTRPMRDGENDGIDHHFATPERFLSLRDDGELLESAEVYGNWYGVPRQQVRDAMAQGRDVLVRVDIQGAESIRDLAPEAVSIFLAPADMGELRKRLESRASETGSVLEKRIQAAWGEMEHLPKFDYHVVNRDGCLEEAVRNIDSIVTAEKCRSVPRRVIL